MTRSFLPDRLPDKAKAPTCLIQNPPTPQKEPLKHLLIGSPHAVRSAIHALHVLGYAEVGAWSPFLPTGNPGEVMSILIRQSIAGESVAKSQRD
ncbi:MAG TPA: hypothetical protein IGS17_17905 [Oscillatoriales cyanobacterium M59_W2019_021]|nr:hypothetical protein [Oscillatoriales cyanobacterium M4454_W2019_049]HIK52778.1 hypothetical protein [Oscillatoriales cyanobacterium M59_W2019_021]